MKFLWCFIFTFLGSSQCARIFGIFSTPSISHQIVFHALVKDLAARGHHLTILTTDLMKTQNPNITQIDLHGSYDTSWKDVNQVEIKLNGSKGDFFKKILHVHSDVMNWQLSHPEVHKIIHNAVDEKFDVVLAELNFQYVALAFGEIFDCPVIDLYSMDSLNSNYGTLGNEVNPVIHPEPLIAYSHGKLKFAERFHMVMLQIMLNLYYEPLNNELNMILLKRHFPSVKTSISDLRDRVKLLMVNTNPALGFIRPLLPNTIQLGFMHIEKPNPLPDGELKDFLEKSKNGVIYMSLGSNAKSKDLKSELIQIFLNAFSKLDVNVLWKFEDENFPRKPKNVMISKWLPQQNLLAHPKVKLFITHGGQQSMEEAIDRTVPMIVIPIFGDQHVNAMKMEEKEIGETLDITSLTEQKLLSAIDEMMKPKYKKNIQQLRELVYDQPMTSRERAVWWTEFIIRHKGAKHLEYPGRLVPFYQKYFLDFVAIAIFLIAFVVTILHLLVKKIMRRTLGKAKKE